MRRRPPSEVADAPSGIRGAVDEVQQLPHLRSRFGIRPKNVVFQPEIASVKPDVLGEDRAIREHQCAGIECAVDEGMACKVHRLADEVPVAVGAEMIFRVVLFLHD